MPSPAPPPPRPDPAFRAAIGLTDGEARVPARAFFDRLAWEPAPRLASVRVDEFFTWLEPRGREGG